MSPRLLDLLPQASLLAIAWMLYMVGGAFTDHGIVCCYITQGASVSLTMEKHQEGLLSMNPIETF